MVHLPRRIHAVACAGPMDPLPTMNDTNPIAPAVHPDTFGSHAEWYRVTLDSIGDAVITADTQGHITFMNAVAVELTGWSAKEAMGVPLPRVFSIINKETGEPAICPAVRALAEGVTVLLASHTMLRSKQGGERRIDDSAAPIRDDNGVIVGVVLIFRDITDRSAAEAALQENEERYRTLFESMDEGFCVIELMYDKDGVASDYRFISTNPMFEKQSGLKDAVGRTIHELVPNIEPTWVKVYAEVVATGVPFHMEDDVRSMNRWLDVNAYRIGGPESKRVAVLFSDITSRKQTELALQTSELNYRRLFETAKDGILILDADTMKVVDANPYMTELLGYSYAEFNGKELWEIGFFSDKQGSQAMYHELHENGFIRYDHLPLESKTGDRAEVEFVCNTYRVVDRNIAQCNIRDISERSRLEKKTHEQALSLADLHRRKDEFLAMLSHELRNPLAPIANAVQLLQLQPNEDPLQQQARNIIERQVVQLTHLVDDLMEVSRITTGRVQLRQERVVINGIVERALETVRPLIDRHRHELTVALSPAPVWLYADPARMEQVIVNLLTNAAKYTPEGGRLGLSVEQAGDECVVRVRDNGVGIAPELLPRVFDLFTQAERSLDRSQGGLGIGLALVQRLVDLHRGRVEVISALGQGSEFIVRLPVAISAAPVQAQRTTLDVIPNGHSLRVLVVDDNLDLTQSLEMLLKNEGHEVRIANDGPSALRMALEFLPQVALLDIGLPEMNGYELAKKMREQELLDGIVLVAVTGYGQASDRQFSLAAGFDHHLVKPAVFAELKKILASIELVTVQRPTTTIIHAH